MSIQNSLKSFTQIDSSLSNINYQNPLKSIFLLFPNNSTPSKDTKDNNQISKICFQDKSYYEGEINKINNLPNGKGKLFYFNGEVFFGNFVDGNKEGEGEYHYKDGTIYIGSWKNDKKNGKGIYICEENNWIFYGIFNNDIPGIGRFEKFSKIYGKNINNNIIEEKYIKKDNNFSFEKNSKLNKNKNYNDDSIKRENSKKIIKCDELFFDYCPVIKNLNFNM